jgi:hypothetical protein
VQRPDLGTRPERPLGLLRERRCLLRVDEAEAVEPRVDVLDPGEAGGDDLDRRELARPDAAGELGSRGEGELEVDGQRTTRTSQ